MVAYPHAGPLESVDALGGGVDCAVNVFEVHQDFDDPGVVVSGLVLDFHTAAGCVLGGQELGEQVVKIAHDDCCFATVADCSF